MKQYSPNKVEIKAIQSNDINFFNGKYSEEQKQGFLRESISHGKLDVIKFFIEQGTRLINNTCLDSLAKRKNKVKIFKYLHDKGIDVAPRGNFPLIYAALNLSVENAQYLEQFSEYDAFVFSRGITWITYREKHFQEKTPLLEFEPILKIFLKKISATKLNEALNTKGNEKIYLADENKKYIFSLYLSIHMQEDKKDIKKMKI